ncbi:hypothetical protein RchiOBHm_Chr1g0331551 [Rosa chinensis]|uniref:Uncharacterized protein n=1 Tax=Rosa chinensis TaxID=74649 RepID=A0A2P6SBK3_ROSCH|nr:hypothetical protein RchiOBHm_Chr1g0331551 [Rosa chinensis]
MLPVHICSLWKGRFCPFFALTISGCHCFFVFPACSVCDAHKRMDLELICSLTVMLFV